MATYFTSDFADWSTDWTEQYNTGADWPGALSSGDVLIPQATNANDWTAHSWNDVDGDSGRADIDVLALVNASSLATTQRFLFVRGSGADETATHFHFSLGSGSHSVGYCSGSDTRTNVATFSVTYSSSTDYWCRFRITGSGTKTYKTKVWTGTAADEPGGAGADSNWDLNSTTASGPDAAGWAGPCFFSNTGGGVLTLKQLGIGTNGDTAPSSAGAAATSLAFGPRFPMAIMNF